MLPLLAAFACAALAETVLVEANTATQAQLERMKGVGVSMSERLLAARAEAPFKDWDDLRRRVPGIGERVAQRLSDQGLRVEGRALQAPKE